MDKNYLLLLISLLLMSACQSIHQPKPFIPPANATVIDATFKHLAISQTGESQRLHVYIEGDGLPFINRFQIARDPSPSNPLMLALMGLDKNERLYLGRPCYFSLALPAMADAKCNARMWTSARYSDEVVNSMVAALRHYLGTHKTQGITLIGHSGGGALAMLMAARMNEVDQVVTLAGNLDTQAWTSLHYYTPLKASLNPADLTASALPAKQLHFVGDRDNMVPPELGQAFLQRIGQPMQILPNADHNCCWFAQWNQLLERINRQMNP